MRRCLWIILLLAVALSGCTPHPPRHLAYWESTTNSKGWVGRRYTENDRIVAEEWDTDGKDGRVDLWRDYWDGVRTAERCDRDGDSRIDYRAKFHEKTGGILSFERDTNLDGRMNLSVELIDNRLWRHQWDRNHDGHIDYRFIFAGTPTSLSDLGVDFFEVVDLSRIIPRTAWRLLAIDTNFDGAFDTWAKFQAGEVVARGIGPDKGGKPSEWVAGPLLPGAPHPAPTPTAPTQPTPVDDLERTSIIGVVPATAEELAAQENSAAALTPTPQRTPEPSPAQTMEEPSSSTLLPRDVPAPAPGPIPLPLPEKPRRFRHPSEGL